jgi:cytochrome P450/NADPH-cytochrome P450 reductase
MFDEMCDLVTQPVAKWTRMGLDEHISTTNDYTWMALCAVDQRFTSFYKEELHPFVTAMAGFLI